MTDPRPVNEIQAALMAATENLRGTIKDLRLVELMTELERRYPDDLDLERVGEGDECPPLACEMHADVGNATILLEEVIGSLEKASRRTVHEVRKEWIGEKLKEVKDPSARALLSFLLESAGSED